MYFLVFLSVCVSIWGPKPHTTRTVVLMEAVIHHSSHYCRSRLPLMCSFHCVISSPSFNSSVFVSFFLFFFFAVSVLPLLLSLCLSYSLPLLYLLTSFWLCLPLLLRTSSFWSFCLKWLSCPLTSLSSAGKGTVCNTHLKPMGKNLEFDSVFVLNQLMFWGVELKLCWNLHADLTPI